MSRRKRSIASILNEESESTSSRIPTSRSSRSAYNFINDETEEAALNQQSSTQPYNKVICNCPKCNGKLVERRTKAFHEIDQYSDNDLEESSFGVGSRPLPSFGDTSAESQLTEESRIGESEMDESEIDESEMNESEIERSETGFEEENDNDKSSASTDNDEDEFTFLPRQHLRTHKIRPANINYIIEIEDTATADPFECTTEEDESTNTQDENEPFNNEYREIFEDYSCPDFDPFQDANFTQPINDS
jgi:ssDNA-binding Zn-finger/Zn-ribbon topoisomerase 1